MRLALVAHGLLPIPPTGWGAVEWTIWQRAERLRKRGHHVDVFNTTYWHSVVDTVNEGEYDLVHLHNELFALPFSVHLQVPWAITSHYGGLTSFQPDGQDRPFNYLFRDLLLAPAHIALSNGVAELLRSAGYKGLIRVVENSVEHEAFRVIDQPQHTAVCVGRVVPRKRQAWLADAAARDLSIDFVGPWSVDEEPAFRPRDGSRWLGEWDRATLHERLGEYACLVLLSEAEGATPKVVLEALAAGVSVVVSQACAGQLEDWPFVTILPDDASPGEVIHAIRAAAASNQLHRAAIRTVAGRKFGYEAGLDRYLPALADIIRQTATLTRRR